MLPPYLDTLKKGAETCVREAQLIDQKFEFWLLYVCGLHAACVQKQTSAGEALQSNQLYLVAEQVRLESQKSAVDMSKKTAEGLSKQLDIATDAFKKASDEFPDG